MKTSNEIGKIAAALLKAQKTITFAKKDVNNPFFKSKYADLPSVIDAVKPALNDAGIAFIQTGSPSTEGILAVTTRLIHESGEWIEDTATCPLQKHDPQGFGSAMTYLRRYSLAAITGLYQDDDDGNAASGVGEKVKPVAKQYMAEHNFKELASDVNGLLIDDPEPNEHAAKKLISANWRSMSDEQKAYLKEAFPEIFNKEAA